MSFTILQVSKDSNIKGYVSMTIYTKICTRCKNEKSISSFGLNSRSKSKLNHWCRECCKESKLLASRRDKVQIEFKKCTKCLKDIPADGFCRNNRASDGLHSQCKKCDKEYRQENLEKTRQYERNKRKTDPIYKLKKNIRRSILQAFKKKGLQKESNTREILGCDYDTFINHLVSQFDEHMTLENHGTYWEIDHIIPLCIAETEEDIIRLNHYTNLQPLESYYNRHIKKDKIL